MVKKQIKCPFCDNIMEPTKKNTRRGYYRGIYLTKCEKCKTEVIIKADDIDWETEQ